MRSAIISLGGSLIVPKDIDHFYLKEFKSFVLKRLDSYRFAIVCGAGKTSSNYMYAAKMVSNVSDEDLDWIGIASSRANAELVRAIFGGLAHEQVITDPTKSIRTKRSILVAAGWKPGWSTDYVAVRLAQKLKVKEIANLTNIDYVHDKDPKLPDSKAVFDTTWAKYRKMISKRWSPRLSTPFDPVASQLAQKLKMKVGVMNGRHLSNLDLFLEGRRFDGTLIH